MEELKNHVFKKYKYEFILIFFIFLQIAISIYVCDVGIDDAPITYRYAENIANGKGFVYNEGEHVLGTTTPLFTLILSLFAYLKLNVSLISNIINIISAAICSVLLYKIISNISGKLTAIYSVILLSTCFYFIMYSVSGMESVFFTILVLLSFYFYKSSNFILSGLFSGLTVLTRIDGLLVPFIIFFDYFILNKNIRFLLEYKKNSKIFMYLSAFIMLILPWLIYATLTFGSFVPQSLIAKRGHTAGLSILANNLFLHQWVNMLNYTTLIYLLLFSIIFIILHNSERKKYSPYFLFLFLYPLSFTLIRVEGYPWYFVPPIPFIILLGSLGIFRIIKQMHKTIKKESTKKIFIVLIILGMILFQTHYLKMGYNSWDNGSWHEIDKGRIQCGQWLHANCKPNDTLLIGAIGHIGYSSGIKIIDSAGLITKLPKNVNIEQYFNPDYMSYIGNFDREAEEINYNMGDYSLIKTFPLYLTLKNKPMVQLVYKKNVSDVDLNPFHPENCKIDKKYNIDFENKIKFLSYSVKEKEIKKYTYIHIKYYWIINNTFSNDYKVFVHFKDLNGKIIFRNDHELLYGLYRNSLSNDAIVFEEYLLPINSQGNFSINIGVYNNTRRLKIFNPNHNTFELNTSQRVGYLNVSEPSLLDFIFKDLLSFL